LGGSITILVFVAAREGSFVLIQKNQKLFAVICLFNGAHETLR